MTTLWIKSYQSLDRHPKTVRAAKLLGVSRAAIIGHLHLLWHWALDYAEDGDLSKLDADEIAFAADWGGEPADFIDALVNCGSVNCHGFLEREGDELWIHDWEDYAGTLISRRKANAQRMREARATHVQRTCSTRVQNVQGESKSKSKRKHINHMSRSGDLDGALEGSKDPKTGVDHPRSFAKISAKPTRTIGEQAFCYWAEVMGKAPTVRYDGKRRTACEARAKDSTLEEIKLAIDGCRASPHNMGDNDRGTAYNDLELICRSRDGLERFAERVGRRPGEKPPDLRARRQRIQNAKDALAAGESPEIARAMVNEDEWDEVIA